LPQEDIWVTDAVLYSHTALACYYSSSFENYLNQYQHLKSDIMMPFITPQIAANQPEEERKLQHQININQLKLPPVR